MDNALNYLQMQQSLMSTVNSKDNPPWSLICLKKNKVV